MREAPQHWAELMGKTHKTELRADINGVSYYGYDGASGIWSCSTHRTLFDTFGVGSCCSATIDLVLVNPSAIPKMAKIELYVRLSAGATVTQWVRRGIFYIDTRQWDAAHEFLTITGYDAMLMLEQPYFTAGSIITGWPKTDAEVVEEICERAGLTLDERTVLDREYEIQIPAVSSDGKDSDSLRDVLGWIGAMYAGNWTITDEGELRLVGLMPSSNDYLVDEAGDPITFGGDRILV